MVEHQFSKLMAGVRFSYPAPMKERPYPEGYAVGKEDWHFARRLYERYGLVLWYGELGSIRRKMKSRKGRLVQRYEKERKVFEVRDLCISRTLHEGLVTRRIPIRLVANYDHRTKEVGLVTALHGWHVPREFTDRQ
jgi:hypothetical protein